MNLSAKTEYACLAMLELALHYCSGEPVRVRRITDRHGIPAPFLVQIFQELKRTGLVTSTRGAAGGYQLARPPQDITLAQVLDVFEAQQEPSSSANTDSVLAGVLIEVCEELASSRREYLERHTLADLLERAAVPLDPMWYI
jgi:Rrf2 family protein